MTVRYLSPEWLHVHTYLGMTSKLLIYSR
jgi:hypothetical protein